VSGRRELIWPVVVALVLAACNAGGGTPASPFGRWGANVQQVCPGVGPGYAQCLALRRTDVAASFSPATIAGLTPADFQSAYDLPSASQGKGQIVALVDAYDNPQVAHDLATYRSQFGLGTAQFTKYNQEGQIGNYPPGDVNWGLDIDLEVEMVSATCPNCTIYLVEANANTTSDLAASEAEAAKLGAKIVSNSWICYGSSNCGDQTDFAAPGVTYLGSAGDQGYGTGGPMAYASVVAVGGTTLTKASNKRGWSERVWGGTGGGCAPDIPKPAWQHDPDCSTRMANDVAADADPATGPAMYDSYGEGGWFQVGGTSAAAPLVAGVFGLAGNASEQNGGRTFWLKKHQGAAQLYHVTSGNDGTCSPSYFCTAGTHEYRDYGGPTGWGTPHGIGAF
jgi:subtilase family serine protease